jgi:pimeloyl-ACP methyl ester carboxylesterase
LTIQFTTSPDQVRLAFEVHGVGPALMLLHGGGSRRQDWIKGGYVERLKREFTVITVDLRGHGESDKPMDPNCYTTEKMGQDFLAVADACGFGRFSLCGYSFGGNIGRYLAARSERVEKFVLIGSSFGAGVSGEFRQFVLDFRERWAPVVCSLMGDPPTGSLDLKLLSQPDQEAASQLSFPGELIPMVMAWSSAMLDWEVVGPRLIRCPALWLFGTANENVMKSYLRYEKELSGSQVQVHKLEGFDHAQEFDEIDQVFPVWLDFIRKE